MIKHSLYCKLQHLVFITSIHPNSNFEKMQSVTYNTALKLGWHKVLRRNPIEDGAISGFSGQKSVPE